jgi:hypothetical protein
LIADYTKKSAPREMNDGILVFVTDFSAIKTSIVGALSIGTTLFKEYEDDNRLGLQTPQ